MKILFWFFMFITLGIGNSLADSIPAFSKIEKVIVFENAALIKRSASFTLNKGENVFVFSGLPSLMQDNSLQVSIGNKNIKILEVKIDTTYILKNSEEHIKDIKNKIKKLTKEIRFLEGEIEYLIVYSDFLRKSFSDKSNLKDWKSYVQFVNKGLKENYRKVSEFKGKLLELKEEKENLEKELANLGGQKQEQKKITLYLKALKATKAKLEFSYLVSSSGWRPVYDVAVDTEKSSLIIDCYAQVFQNTGEDWKDVSLEISTSRPIYGKPQELSVWYVDIAQARRPVLYKSPGISADLNKEVLAVAETKALSVKENAFSFSFLLPDKVSIPSDRQKHRIFLTSKSITETKKLLIYEAIPKVSPYVYLTANLSNPFSFPLLIGKVNIYLDGRFVGTDNISKTLIPKEVRQIFLGIDESIRVKRNRIKKFTEYAGVVSKVIRVHFEYEIEIKNGKNKLVELKVKDNYPISLNEKVKVKFLKPTAKEASISKKGIITWNLKLKPKEIKKLTLSFTVEYPKDESIIGLE